MRRGFVAGALALVLLPLFTAQACGPDFAPDVFVRKLRPDKPKEFAEGKLGILQPTFPREDLTVAFRYLNGGSLSASEQAAYHPTYSNVEPEWWAANSTPDTQKQLWKATALGSHEGVSWGADRQDENAADEPAESWQMVRARYAAPAPKVEQDRVQKVQHPGGWTSDWSYLNCNGNAFRTAVLTVQSRAKTWGEKSPDLADWIQGQDAVFGNCTSGVLVLPAAASQASSALLQADRAYQIAAAQFYAGNFEDARKAFVAVGRDSASPWHGLGGYLAARCLVREAFLSAGPGKFDEAASYDPALMRQAADLLRSLLNEPTPGLSKEAIQRELNLVLLRIEPEVRLRELAAALAGPKIDPDYDQHLKDLTWFLDVQFDGKDLREETRDFTGRESDAPTAADFSAAYAQSSAIRASAPLVDWLLTFQSPAKEAKTHALDKWRSTRQVYWLLAAITKASGTDAAAADLVKAAQEAKPDSPAWESLTYHRARLLIALGRVEEARALLDQSLPKIRASGRGSSLNAYTGLRMRAAANLNEFFSYAPREILLRTSVSQSSLDECVEVMKNPKRQYDCDKAAGAEQLSEDAARFFNTQAPLSVWLDAAKSTAFSEQLRRSIAMTAWVRSVFLKDDAAAAEFFPLLPEKLQEQAGKGTGFRAVVTIVRNPGLGPYLDAGVQRSYSYDFVESYRDNWGCREWQASGTNGTTPLEKESVAFLTKAESSEEQQQAVRLAKQGNLGDRVLAYANDHPDDPDVPEALYLVLRMIRYGCDFSPSDNTAETKDDDAIKKSAARLLRRRYPTSPWTKKAAPIAG